MDTQPQFNSRKHGPSLFFPIMIITVGVIWLFVNAGRIPVENIYRLFPLWPVLLIGLGLGLMLQRVSWVLSGLLWLAVAGLAVWLVVAPPAFLPSVQTQEMKHQTLQEPLDNASRAEIKLNLSINPVEIHTLQEAEHLFTADIYYLGNLQFDSSGSGGNRRLELSENVSGFPWSFPNDFISVQNKKWEINLSPKPLTTLEIDQSTGNADIDLKGVQLDRLSVKGSTGNMTINLPENSPAYNFTIDASTGNIQINAPSGSVFNLEAKASTGNITINLPQDAGVQVEVQDAGIGHISIPGTFTHVSQGSNQGEGIWQNSDFSNTKTPIKISLNGSIGNITIK